MKKCHWEGNEFIGCCEEVKTNKHGNVLILIYNSFGAEYNSFDFCPFCGANLKKPVIIEKGMFGTFYNEEADRGKLWGELVEVYGKENRYCINGGRWFKYFSPGLPEGFKNSGEPINE